MKKLLALVLALVMTMSLVTISNAAFKDADSIDYKEAVEVMNAVGVLIGDENQNFNAKDTLTRAQAAKIIAYLDLGKTTADAIVGTGAVFTDVKASAWYAGFVEYCAGAGYVAGMGDKTFAPDAKVTGVQFAKMLLCALGYSAETEGYIGTDYTIAIARDANKNDLFKGLSISASAVLTREQAAQMAYNALKATCVEYQGGTSVSTSDGTKVVVNATRNEVKRTSGDDYRGGSEATVNGTQQLVEKLYGSDLKFTASAGTDAFGRKVESWKYKANEVGQYASGADYTLTGKVTQAKLYATLGSTVADALKSSAEADADAKLTLYVDGTADSTYNASGAKITLGKNNSTAVTGGNGSVTEIYVDTDTNAVTLVTINTYVVKATDNYNAKKDTVSVSLKSNASFTVSSLDGEDFAISDVKKDDYLLVTAAGSTASSKTVKSVKAATIVTGTVSTFDESDSVTIGGTKYSYAATIPTTGANSKAVNYDLGSEATVVTDGTYIYYVDEAIVGANTYVYIQEIAKSGTFSTGGYSAIAYFTDGTTKTIVLKDKYSDDSAVTATTTGAWYKYTVSSDKYTLEKLATDATGSVSASGTQKLTENGKIAFGNGQTFRANASTIFVVVDSKDNVTAYTGIANVPTITVKADATVTASYVVDSDNTSYAKYVFIDADNATIKGASSAASDTLYVLKLKSTTKVNDNDTVYVYEAILNGEKTTVTSNVSLAIYNYYEGITYDKNGYIDSTDPAVAADAAHDFIYAVSADTDIAYAGSVLSLAGKTAVVADDAKVFMVATKADSAALLDDANATYELTETSAEGLYNTLKEYNGSSKTLGVKLVGVLDDKDNDTIVALYVYVTAAR